MNIEKEIFKKSVINFDKLLPYGFEKSADRYIISKNILKDSFRIDVEISPSGLVKGKIYDLSFGEEYTNYRIETQTGKFVNQIRSEFEDFLTDIREHCTKANYFLTNQANRLAGLIMKQYGDAPEFLWDKSPGSGVFRNPRNGKWYGLIMNINKSKIDTGDEDVEVLNVKLAEDEVQHLLNQKGFYKAYHMNKKNWISVLLDDTLRDEEIISYLEESHKFTVQADEWLIPANPKYYDIINCFNDTDTTMWKQSSNINVGDIIYMYVAAPYSAILYKCEAVEVNIPYGYKDKNISMSKVMKIKLLERFDKDKYTFDKLREYGIKAVRGPRTMPKELSKEINGE